MTVRDDKEKPGLSVTREKIRDDDDDGKVIIALRDR
jgi:hypothetical protein